MTRAGAEVAAFAITLALTGVGCTIGGALGCYLGGVAGSYLGAKYKCATIQCAPGEGGRDTAMGAIPYPAGPAKALNSSPPPPPRKEPPSASPRASARQL